MAIIFAECNFSHQYFRLRAHSLSIVQSSAFIPNASFLTVNFQTHEKATSPHGAGECTGVSNSWFVGIGFATEFVTRFPVEITTVVASMPLVNSLLPLLAVPVYLCSVDRRPVRAPCPLLQYSLQTSIVSLSARVTSEQGTFLGVR